MATHTFGDDATTINGMLLSSGLTWPFATMTVDPEWCRLAPLGLGAPVWIDRDEVQQVRLVKRMNARGAAFEPSTGSFGDVVFFRWRIDDVSDVLAAAHWPVLLPSGTFRGSSPGPR